MKEFIVGFLKDEDGLETVEMVILLVVIVGIAFAFRKTLITWYNGFIKDSQSQTKGFATAEEGVEFK
ncbi:MAG: Flp1 family type IVb pilin [Eubacteriales bacterium]